MMMFAGDGVGPARNRPSPHGAAPAVGVVSHPVNGEAAEETAPVSYDTHASSWPARASGLLTWSELKTPVRTIWRVSLEA